MITVKTVFVLGAGASRDCGFPLGKELISEITSASELWNEYALSPNRSKPYYEILNCDKKDFVEFCRLLSVSPAESIDIFLENYHQYEEFGKCLIAAQLIKHEILDELIGNRFNRGRWYETLFNNMGKRREEFEKSIPNVTFITFNYDRSLEYYLFTQLQNAFQVSENYSASIVQSIKIFHVYGSLCPPHFLDKSGRNYTHDLSPDIIRKASSTIQIMHGGPIYSEEIRKTFEEPHYLIRMSKKIVFLGFGYHEENIRRLMPEFASIEVPEIIGTGLGLGPVGVSRARNLFDRKHKIEIVEKTIMELIRDHPVFE